MFFQASPIYRCTLCRCKMPAKILMSHLEGRKHYTTFLTDIHYFDDEVHSAAMSDIYRCVTPYDERYEDATHLVKWGGAASGHSDGHTYKDHRPADLRLKISSGSSRLVQPVSSIHINAGKSFRVDTRDEAFTLMGAADSMVSEVMSYFTLRAPEESARRLVATFQSHLLRATHELSKLHIKSSGPSLDDLVCQFPTNNASERRAVRVRSSDPVTTVQSKVLRVPPMVASGNDRGDATPRRSPDRSCSPSPSRDRADTPRRRSRPKRKKKKRRHYSDSDDFSPPRRRRRGVSSPRDSLYH